MNLSNDKLSNDKDFDLAVDMAIEEIFGKVEAKPDAPLIEDDSLKTPLELEPLDLEPLGVESSEESKVIDFPHIDELLEVGKEKTVKEGLTQQDLEKLAAALLSLEWELSPETSEEFLKVLEEAKNKSNERLHEIFALMHEVGSWLKERPQEARPEWLHFLHQGVVALNLVSVHGKDPEPYIARLKKALQALKQKPKTREERLIKALAKQLGTDYQRFLVFSWLFAKSPRLKPWYELAQKSLHEIRALMAELPPEWRPDLKKIEERTKRRLQARKARQKKAKAKPEPTVEAPTKSEAPPKKEAIATPIPTPQPQSQPHPQAQPGFQTVEPGLEPTFRPPEKLETPLEATGPIISTDSSEKTLFEKAVEEQKIIADRIPPQKEFGPEEQQQSPPFKEAYLCCFDNDEILVPLGSVAYVGEFKKSWRSKVAQRFPLKLLLGFWAYMPFSLVRLQNKLTGKLALKEEKELRQMVFPVIKESLRGNTLVIVWEKERGGVLVCNEAVPLGLPDEAVWIPGRIPIVVVGDRKIPVFSW